MSREIDMAYMAGFFDGEGCIHLGRYRKGKSSASLTIILVQKESEPIVLASELWPQGKITVAHRNQEQNKGKSYWQFKLHGKAAADALAEMFPYLRGKRDQAKLAIDYQDTLNAFKGGNWSKWWTPEMVEYRNRVAQELSDMKRTDSSAPTRAGATTES